MRKPFKAGRWTLVVDTYGCWDFGTDAGRMWYLSDADLRHINRITAKALKYRARGKAK